MGIFIQLLINSLIAGSIYALVASGFSLIYSTNGFAHFAHGTTVAVGGYVAYFFLKAVGMPFWVAGSFGVVAAGLLGVLLFEFIYTPLVKRRAAKTIILIASVGVLIFVENLILMLFGADVKSFNVIPIEKGNVIFGAIITTLQIGIIVVSVALLSTFFIWMKWAKSGRALKAVADNQELSAIAGINVRKVQRQSFVLGSLIAGLGGILIGLEQNLETTMGTSLIIKGFTGAVIGGINSLPGSILGSFLVGVAENFGIWWLPSGWKDAIAFVLLFAFLLFRPNGILGVKKTR